MTEKSQDKDEEIRRRDVNAVLSFVVALGVVVFGGFIAFTMFISRSQPEIKETERPVPTVDSVPVEVGSHVVEIDTQGVIESLREVRLAAQISGRVIQVSDDLEDGAHVEKDQELVWIEDEDYQAARSRALSSLRDAELNLELEEARGEQARIDWEKLGRGEPTDLALRLPQIKSAKARVASAEEEVNRAQRDLERCIIKAPFSGRVRMAQIEEGAFVTPGSVVAEIFSDEDLEVRLPFSLKDFGFLRTEGTPPFEVRAEVGGEMRIWPAEIIRVDGEVDRSTLSGYATARVGANASGAFPPVGLFVEATVKGVELDGVVELPRETVLRSDEIWVARVNEESRELVKLPVNVIRSNRHNHVVRLVEGKFLPGDQVVRTRMETAAEGDIVKTSLQPESAE